jgi:hypothetical protein
MAKVYSAPKELSYNPDFSKGWEAYQKRTKEFEDNLEEYCLRNGEGKYRGKIVSTSVADGSARYMIFGTKGGVKMIHIPTGDAWRADSAWERGVTVSYVEKQVRLEEQLRKLFGE